MIHIVLDLETLSTYEDAAILQIGCCIPEFSRKYVPKDVAPEFVTTISFQETIFNTAFHIDDDTEKWWSEQSEAARSSVFAGEATHYQAFNRFIDWVNSLKSGGHDVAVWGNGSDFDNRLLAYSITKILGKDAIPWNFRNNRDLRTLKALYPVTIEDSPDEIKHTALGDARYEARLIQAIYDTYPYVRTVL